VHWELAPLFQEIHPGLELSNVIFEIDRNRMTAAGGTAPIDMILHWIAGHHGRALALAASEALVHDSTRLSDETRARGRQALISHSSQSISRAVQIMEGHIEDPLPIKQLAELVGLSPRQLERVFRLHTEKTPSQFYREIRLHRARKLIHHSGLSIREISIATGFSTPSGFSKNYRQRFRQTPTRERLSQRSGA